MTVNGNVPIWNIATQAHKSAHCAAYRAYGAYSAYRISQIWAILGGGGGRRVEGRRDPPRRIRAPARAFPLFQGRPRSCDLEAGARGFVARCTRDPAGFPLFGSAQSRSALAIPPGLLLFGSAQKQSALASQPGNWEARPASVARWLVRTPGLGKGWRCCIGVRVSCGGAVYLDVAGRF